VSEPTPAEGPLTLEQYFAEAEQAAFDFMESAADIPEALGPPPSFDDFPALRDYAAAGGRLYGGLYDGAADALDALEPPAEVAVEHDARVAALEGLAGAYLAYAERVEMTASLPELQQLNEEDPAVNDANERAIEACLAVQAVADARGIIVFLHCDPHTGGQVSNPSPAPGETVEITAEVLDGGEPRPGVDCAFAISSQPGDDASLSSESATTDENGEATVPLDVGGTPGTIEVDVDCAGMTQTFTVEVGGG
jgi:hypothetical protein